MCLKPDSFHLVAHVSQAGHVMFMPYFENRRPIDWMLLLGLALRSIKSFVKQYFLRIVEVMLQVYNY